MTAFDIDWLRDVFAGFDDLADPRPVMGIRDWDDAACAEFCGGRLLLSCDGPYKKRLVMKSALIHASTDVIVKGGKPLLALDTLSGPEKDVREMAESLLEQGMRMKIPILGGNTNLEGEPLASLFVVGRLLIPEPIRQSGGKSGDMLILLGEPLWGSMEERFQKAGALFSCWYGLLAHINAGKLSINSSKDVTKGGLARTAKEIADASGTGLALGDPVLASARIHKYRNLDNFLLSAGLKDAAAIKRIAASHGCPCVEAGRLV